MAKKPTDLEGRFDEGMKKGAKQDSARRTRGTSDGHMVENKIPPYPMKGGGFIARLEKHKQIGQSFDNGTWKPRYKGQTFRDAIEEHKSASSGEFI